MTRPEAAAVEDMTFEEALAALEQVVTQLESGKVPLDQSIALYDRGAALQQRCEKLLRDAELKVEKIVAGQEGSPQAVPFGTD